MKKKLKISKKFNKSQDWEILEGDIPIAKLGSNLEDNKTAYKAVQSKINEGVAKERKYREDVLRYANSVKNDKAFGQRVHDYVQQTCGKGNDCIAEATTYLKEAGYLDKVYTSNSHFQDDIKSGKLKNFSITPGNFINANTVKPADIVQTTHSIQDPNNPNRKFSGQPKHAMLVSKAQTDSIGNIAEFAYIGNQADAARTHGEYDRTSMMGSFGSGDFQIIKPDFVDQSLVRTRDSLTKEIQKEEPLFNKNPKLIRYNDMRPTKLTPANPGNYSALELARLKDTQKMYQPILDNQAELMKKYNLTQKEFVGLLDNLIGVGEAESQQGSLMSPRYLAKQIPGMQFLAKHINGEGAKVFDSGEYSTGPWQTKGKYVPKTSYERGSALEGFATMADRYKNEVSNTLKGTDAGFNEAVNKYKGLKDTQNEYLKRVRDTDAFNIEVDGQTQELPKYIGRKQPTPNQPQQIMPELRDGGYLPMMPDGGYTWSTNTAQAPTQQVVGSVENVQTSKPSIQPFQKGYVNPNIMTSKTGEEGLGDDLGGMMVTAALAPGSLPFKASSRLGRVALGAGELANPISGFRGIKPKFALQNTDPILTNQTKGFNVEYDGLLDFQKKADFKPYKFDNKNWYDVPEPNLTSITEDIITPQGFQNRVFDSNIQLGSFQNKGHLSEKGFNYRTLSERELEAIQNNKGVFPKQGKAKGGNENVKYWTKGNEKNWYGDNINQQFIRVKENKFVKDKVVHSDNVEFFNHQTGKFEPISNYKPTKKLGGKIKLKPKSSDWEIVG